MSLLVQKYQILQQQADNQGIAARAAAAEANARAGAIPVQTAASANVANAQAYATRQQGENVTPLAKSEIGLRGAQGGYSAALTKQTLAPFDPANAVDHGNLALNHFLGLGHFNEVPPQNTGNLTGARAGYTGSIAVSPSTYQPVNPVSTLAPPDAAQLDRAQDSQQDYDDGSGFSKGTPKIPGHGDGTVDTVPAMLAPGEAVLNKGAAEHVGRGMIAQINKIGLARMGEIPDAKAAPAKPAGKGMVKGGMASYAMGIDEVPATAATPETEATQGGLQKRPQKHAKGTAKVTTNPTGDGDSIKERNAALKADPRGPDNDTIALHQPSMLHGMQMMAYAMGMPIPRQGFSKGTSKVSKGKGGKSGAPAPMAAPGGFGPLGQTPATASIPPGGSLSPDQISPLLMALSQQPQGAQ